MDFIQSSIAARYRRDANKVLASFKFQEESMSG